MRCLFSLALTLAVASPAIAADDAARKGPLRVSTSATRTPTAAVRMSGSWARSLPWSARPIGRRSIPARFRMWMWLCSTGHRVTSTTAKLGEKSLRMGERPEIASGRAEPMDQADGAARQRGALARRTLESVRGGRVNVPGAFRVRATRPPDLSITDHHRPRQNDPPALARRMERPA